MAQRKGIAQTGVDRIHVPEPPIVIGGSFKNSLRKSPLYQGVEASGWSFSGGGMSSKALS